MDATTWNERYRSSERVWTGEPNSALVAFAPDPTPTADSPPLALDLGCGEGADALWLASRGWDVIGVDWAEVALDRARREAERVGAHARFVQADISDGPALSELSPSGRFDLVTLAYIHPEPDDRTRLYAPLPALVGPGGHLLVVAHAPEHAAHGFPGPDPHRLMTHEDTVAALSLPADSVILVATTWPRERDGVVVAIDSVVLVRRGS
jgi:SAM-dependent methyltransferase